VRDKAEESRVKAVKADGERVVVDGDRYDEMGDIRWGCDVLYPEWVVMEGQQARQQGRHTTHIDRGGLTITCSRMGGAHPPGRNDRLSQRDQALPLSPLLFPLSSPHSFSLPLFSSLSLLLTLFFITRSRHSHRRNLDCPSLLLVLSSSLSHPLSLTLSFSHFLSHSHSLSFSSLGLVLFLTPPPFPLILS
jgi:hypothetical protein